MDKSATVNTDDHTAYKPALKAFARHDTVNHSKARRILLWNERAYLMGKCRQCGKPSEIKPSTGWTFRYCAACRAKVKARKAAKKKVELPAA